MSLGRRDRRHEGPSDLNPDLEVRLRYFELNLETAPNSRIEQPGMIGNSNCHPEILARIQILQQRVHHAFNLADLLRIIAHLRDGIELVEQKNASISISKAE